MKKNIKEKRAELKELLNEAVYEVNQEKLALYIHKGFEYGVDKNDSFVMGNTTLSKILNNGLLKEIWDNADVFKPEEGEEDDDDAKAQKKLDGYKDLGDKILSPRFFQAKGMYDADSEIKIYYIKEPGVCFLVGEDNGATEKYLRGFLATTLKNLGSKTISVPVLNTIANLWLTYTKVDDASTMEARKVYRYGNPYINTDKWVEFKAKWEPDKEVPFPIMQEMFSRIKYGPQVAALFWGIYTGEYKGRQCLWLQGGGGEGKSTIINFLCDQLFKQQFGYVAADETKVTDSARFFIDTVKDSKVIVFQECLDDNLLNSGLIKAISSGVEALSAEGKGTKAKTVYVDAAVMVVSNILPRVEDAEYSISRAMVSHMSPRVDSDGNPMENDPNIAKKMEGELPGFLAWAEEQFNELYVGGSITMPKEYSTYIDQIIGQNDSERKRIITDNFKFDKVGWITVEEFKVKIKMRSDFVNNNDLTKLITWFNRKYQNSVEMKTHPVTKTQYYLGIRAKTDAERAKEDQIFRDSIGLSDKTSNESLSNYNPDGTTKSSGEPKRPTYDLL